MLGLSNGDDVTDTNFSALYIVYDVTNRIYFASVTVTLTLQSNRNSTQ
jgi:hypothetical protein